MSAVCLRVVGSRVWPCVSAACSLPNFPQPRPNYRARALVSTTDQQNDWSKKRSHFNKSHVVRNVENSSVVTSTWYYPYYSVQRS